MTVHSGQLEHRYRQLLRAYPRSYRERRGEEMLSTLLDTARPGQTRPSAGDVADIARGALRERLGLAAVRGFSAGLELAGPISLAFTAAFSASLWLLSPRSPASTVVTVAWLVAVAVTTAAPRLTAWSVSGAWLTTVGAAVSVAPRSQPFLSFQGMPGAEPGGVYPCLLVAGLIATMAALTRVHRPSTVERWAVPAVAAAGVTATWLADVAVRGDTMVWTPSWVTVVQYGPAALVLVGAAMWALRRGTALVWAGLVLSVVVPILWVWTYAPTTVFVRFDTVPTIDTATPVYLFSASRTSPLNVYALSELGRLDGVLGVAIIAGLLATAVAVAARHRRDATGDGRAALASIGAVSRGLAAGLGLFALAVWAQQGNAVPRDVVAAAVPVAAVGLAMLVPAWWGRAVLASGAVTIVVIGYTAGVVVPASYVVVVALLLTVAAASVRTGGRVATAVAAVATLAGLAAISDVSAVGVGDLLWRVYGADPMQQYSVAAVALIPALVWAPVAVLRSPTGWLGGLVAIAAAVAWLSIAIGFAVVDASTLVVAVASCVVLLGATRLATRSRRRRSTV